MGVESLWRKIFMKQDDAFKDAGAFSWFDALNPGWRKHEGRMVNLATQFPMGELSTESKLELLFDLAQKEIAQERNGFSGH